ncbi:MAG TPA: 1-(5-phosphoribosyl)-5-[(5-phosphoribosylamino)methylideneamino]imidazole-4-carboxamide isomerase [Polyangiales bacterium]|jgi:phosphoribosylformimino-5-aminoimidazole carboxamide ribotide isomerase|nr:1-(5-phosphoribosyl)-5-[(5-phosphoribosylamino)methylideneamino]imidazole-4-carboxamide isomerase [Polyangiales bacterium]
MELIPAIDLLGGKVVRLTRGRYDQVTVYSERPVEQARLFYDNGARRLHVVDLDGARSGEPQNIAVIEAILRAVPVNIQIGGGIRNEETAKRWFRAGAERVVLGTAAIKSPALVRKLCADHPSGVVVAVDERDGEVAVEGWLEGSGVDASRLAKEVDGWGVAAILHTVIARDGTREGPDVAATLALQSQVKATVIASGGIGELAHIRDLAARGVRAAVCGRGLLSGSFSVTDAFAAAGMAT